MRRSETVGLVAVGILICSAWYLTGYLQGATYDSMLMAREYKAGYERGLSEGLSKATEPTDS